MTDRPRALAVLAAVFLAGCIVGTTGSYFWLKRPMEIPVRARETGPPPRGPERPRLPELLKLSQEQEKRFGEIMAESRKQLDALRAEQAPKIEAIRAETNHKLLSVLNEEQKEKFTAFMKRMEEERRQAPRRRGGPEPPP
jgi:Spy/CpxP family protein refolding chaperone